MGEAEAEPEADDAVEREPGGVVKREADDAVEREAEAEEVGENRSEGAAKRVLEEVSILRGFVGLVTPSLWSTLRMIFLPLGFAAPTAAAIPTTFSVVSPHFLALSGFFSSYVSCSTVPPITPAAAPMPPPTAIPTCAPTLAPAKQPGIPPNAPPKQPSMPPITPPYVNPVPTFCKVL